MRPATDPGQARQDLEVELQVFDPNQVKKVRSTQRSRAKLFQLLVRAKDAGIQVTAEELEELSDEDAEALVESRRRQIAKGSIVTPKMLSPEHALDLLEQGITDEPPVLQQSEKPFAHSVHEVNLENELAARRRKSPETKPLSEIELAAVASTARKIATGESEPVGMDTPTALLGQAAFVAIAEPEPEPGPRSPDFVETVAAPARTIDFDEPMPVSAALIDEPRSIAEPPKRWQRPTRHQVTTPPVIAAQRDYWMIAAITTTLVAFALMLALILI